MLILTPCGIPIGFLPIRDMAEFPPLPHVTEYFAPDARLLGVAAGHHTARGRQDAGARAAESRRHFVVSEVDAPPGPADTLEPRNDTLAPRPVLEEHADEPLRGLSHSRRLLLHPEPLNVAL